MELAQGFDVAGFSLMTNHFNHARHVTEAIHHHLDMPVIWGGTHPTVRPEECLEVADAVCIGEGEETMLDVMDLVVEGKEFAGIDNLWIRGGERPPLRPLISDLDALPMTD